MENVPANQNQQTTSTQKIAEEMKTVEHELINVEGVIFGWLLVIAIGLVMSGVGSAISSGSFLSFLKTFLLGSGNFILIYPGPIIFPIIVGAIIGREIGKKSNDLLKATKSGFINGVYGGVIYLLAVIIVYVVLSYFNLISFSILLPTIMQNVIAPVAVLILTTIGFASISHIRKTNI